ncbi:MAG: hypothetical protein H6509_00475 [Bryobacterales bacterium]|nr:hypothetical protein [Acidobacteriota bacterium]MCB9383059.1 hypothetical protein [Bryobacterales bacterium]
MHLYGSRWIVLALGTLAGAVLLPGQRASLIDETRTLPSEHPAIDYWSAEPDDAVARLQRRLEGGETTLEHDARFGYLPAVLEALNVPVSSQILVFSKTSFQAVRIFPRMPRAIYHNDTISVGWVRSGDVVEIASLDPKLGVVFYTLDQARRSQPRFQLRTTECISCHAGPATLGIPGLLVRSVHPDRSGAPLRAPTFITDHRSPIEDRWGGWYVSGESGARRHLGNVIYEVGRQPSSLLDGKPGMASSLEPYVSDVNYLRSTSDVVSLMALEHQTRMTNLIVRLGYETRIAMQEQPGGLSGEARETIQNTVEELLRYMLFVDEAPLEEPIRGSQDFARDFEAAGKRDSQGRSLHQLDLDHRLLRYPCSYMIESEAFEALPAPAKDLLYERLWAILSGKDRSEPYAKFADADRQAIAEILADTKDDLPRYWTTDATGR